MIFLILGKPLIFWLGLITLISFSYQIYLGYMLSHGRSDLFKYHRINAFMLIFLVSVYAILSLMYFK
jgi:hypothetical protein